MEQEEEEAYKEEVGEEREHRRPPATYLSALKGINTARKYLMGFDVNDDMMAALSSIENKLYRVQQKVKQQQQLTFLHMWKQ
jgi:hypothetical protein